MRTKIALFLLCVLMGTLWMPAAGSAARRRVPKRTELAEIVKDFQKNRTKQTKERNKRQVKAMAENWDYYEPVKDEDESKKTVNHAYDDDPWVIHLRKEYRYASFDH